MLYVLYVFFISYLIDLSIFILDISITHIESYIISFHVYEKHDRTPHLDPSDFETEDLLSILSRNLPDDPHDYIFGKSIDGKVS